MRNLDFSTLNTGDIVLTVINKDVPSASQHFITSEGNLWVVERVNREASSATLAPTSGHRIAHTLTVQDGEISLAPVTGSETIKPLKVTQSTFEEATTEGLFHRVQAEELLNQFIQFNNKSGLPRPVQYAIEKAYSASMTDTFPSTYLDDMEAAYERMQSIWNAANEKYQRMNESDLKVIDEMLTVARETATAIAEAINATEIEYHPTGQELTITHNITEGFYNRKETVTFREGATALVHGVPYLIGHFTKTRAYVTNPTTGEKVGYLTFTKSNGITLTLNTGEVTYPSRYHYKEIPASTEASVTAYLELEKTVKSLSETAQDTINHLNQNLKTYTGALEAATDMYKKSETTGTAKELLCIHRLIINLETAKKEMTEHAETTLSTFERLINNAYGA
jgi:hypothetical protein